MDRLFAAHNAAGNFDRPIRDHFIGVHIGLGAAAGLPHAQRKMLVQPAFDHLIAGLCDKPRLIGGELAEILIDQRAGFLENAKRANHLARHHVIADIEMKQAALGLRAPILIRRDLCLAH